MSICRITYGVTQWLLFTPNCQKCSCYVYVRIYLHILGIQPDGWKTARSDIISMTIVQETKETQNSHKLSAMELKVLKLSSSKLCLG